MENKCHVKSCNCSEIILCHPIGLIPSDSEYKRIETCKFHRPVGWTEIRD